MTAAVVTQPAVLVTPPFVFRAFWPILDMATPLEELLAAANRELPLVAARAHAEVRHDGRWSIAPSVRVPGSGRVTENVLLYEAPGQPRQLAVYCPRCKAEVLALVDDTGVCITCDSDRDDLLPVAGEAA